MSFKASLAIVLIVALFSMVFCPLIVVAQTARPASHCGGESPQPDKQAMKACCGREAIPVSQIHAPYEQWIAILKADGDMDDIHVPVVLTDLSESAPLFHPTGEHLASLSLLRI